MAKLIRWLLYRWTANRPCRIIKSADNPYLERYFVAKVGPVGIYLHRYVGCDGDRWLHDHPWAWAVGIPLAGSYLEERLRYLCPERGAITYIRHVRWLFPNFIWGHTFHRILSTKRETWTLFVHGRRVKSWGFLEEESNPGPERVVVRRGHAGGGRWLVYSQPFLGEARAVRGWWHTAPCGRDVRRP